MTQQPKQVWETESYQRDTGFVSAYGEDVLGWLQAQKGERILDLGCGDGVLTQKIAESGASVVGVDSSENFSQAAKDRGLDARIMDGQALVFDSEFDGVFSNAALHWMLEPERVISGVWRALKPGGRFAGEMGGFGNIAAIATAMRAVGEAMGGDTSIAAPCFFPDEREYGALLETQGFKVDAITRFARPTPLNAGMRAWLKVMRAPFFEQFGGREEEAYERVIAALQPSMCDFEGKWHADYVRLRFRAVKPL